MVTDPVPAVAGRAAPSSSRLLLRGLCGRCPWCGGRNLFRGRFRLRDACPSCGLRPERGEHDFWSGAWMLNIVGVETAFALLLTLAVVLLWPDVPWTAVLWVGIVGMLVMPLLFFRVSRTLWLAIDLAFQPPRRSDFDRGSPGHSGSPPRGGAE